MTQKQELAKTSQPEISTTVLEKFVGPKELSSEEMVKTYFSLIEAGAIIDQASLEILVIDGIRNGLSSSSLLRMIKISTKDNVREAVEKAENSGLTNEQILSGLSEQIPGEELNNIAFCLYQRSAETFYNKAHEYSYVPASQFFAFDSRIEDTFSYVHILARNLIFFGRNQELLTQDIDRIQSETLMELFVAHEKAMEIMAIRQSCQD